MSNKEHRTPNVEREAALRSGETELRQPTMRTDMSTGSFVGRHLPAGRLGGHAVVVGGSLAGLVTARVLADHFERVTVLERDRYPDGPLPRKGVPQARHLHALLLRGRQILEEVFPGIGEELRQAGALGVDTAADLAWLTPAGWGFRFPSGLELLAFSRDLLDWCVRRRVAALPRVEVREETDVTALIPTGAGNGVRGVVARPRDEGRPEGERLYADLVVDASGRASRAPEWLEALGYPRAEETVVNAHVGYASRFYARPRGPRADWKALYVQAAPPGRRRAGIAFPVEGGRLLVSLSGGGRDYPSTDEAAFLEFARSLPTPMLYDVLKAAEPLTPIAGHRGTENRLRHYERMPRWPERFVVLGDAACAFNPVYGQGMTVAALGAAELGRCLAEQPRHEPDGCLSGLAVRFQRRLARLTAAPWMFATSEDLRYREVEGSAPGWATRLMHRYVAAVIRLSTRHAGVRKRLLEVFHMLRPPAALFHPGVLFRVAAQLAFRAPRHER
jgi:2-polyprenyl-6-methoxyphenol hydroxylase-like FAD-dependent oxidoreductase